MTKSKKSETQSPDINENYYSKTKEQCEALLQMIYSAQPLYENAGPETKRLIRSIVGAGLFYLPANKNLHFTGMTSKKAKELGQQVQEHETPRSVGAHKILTHNWGKEKNPVDTLVNLYTEKYAKYNYVTQDENQKLRPFQKLEVFKTPEIAYELAGIELEEFK